MRKLMTKIYIGIMFQLALVSVVLADNCSSPGDCMQTAGYNAMVAIGGGVLGIVTALFGSRLAELLRQGITDAIHKLPDANVTDVLVSEANAATGIPMLPPSIRFPLPGTAIRLDKPPSDPGGPSPGQPPSVSVSSSTVQGDEGTNDSLDDFEKDMGDEMLFSAEDYQQIAKDAAREYFYDCGMSVREIAKNMGHEVPKLRADDLVSYMKKNWKQVNIQTAKRIGRSRCTRDRWPTEGGACRSHCSR